jgi:lipopolysaccharide assembly protein A
MRVVWIVAALLFVTVGAVFSALNADRVAFDFYYFQTDLPKAAALIAALLVGWLVGGLVLWFSVVMPLRRRVSRQRRELAQRELVPVRTPE